MSLLNQQRVRIAFNPENFLGDERPWEAYCPCCWVTPPADCTGVFATWAEAMAWAEAHLDRYHCRFCIDQQMPAGRDDVLGELFESCCACTLPCGDCDGYAVYPARYSAPTDLINDLASIRLTPIFCDGCTGVIAVIPLDPEVYA
ncbi:hypothetical protein KZ829_23465 [Actinoplanes hulinensis]|uniref:Uncharacterized protein n=1 Tax=Actinoplanes hulinensis TaxID=1144547 RepID=A0ABS7B6P8_9ACTN|nr:hypothetical protein [Actinoplanes hulinensis]MBW6436705.1 hypothetical protein [Actinoplanes hulinensis]